MTLPRVVPPSPIGGATITYTNKLKSYPITFYKVKRDGNAGVPSYFKLSSSTGLIAEQLYPAQSGTGEFFPHTSGKDNAFYVGSYTLTETFLGENYLPLDGLVTFTLSTKDGGTLTSSDPDHVMIEKVDNGDPTKGFKVTVYNQQTVKINIEKVLSDPILSGTRAFNFRVQYEYELLGKTVKYDNYDVSKENNGLVSIRSGASAEARVPVNAKLTVSEYLSATDKETFDTSIVRTYKDGDESKTDKKVDGIAYVYSSESGSNHGVVKAENDGDKLTFTNTRQTVDVTVKKTVEGYDSSDPERDDNYFTFEATLLNGGIPIGGYPIDLNGTPEDATDDVKTDNSGKCVFYLQHDGTNALSVPRGARLTIKESAYSTTSEHAEDVDMSEYSTSVTALFSEDAKVYSDGTYAEDGRLYNLNPVPTKALTVTFTNGSGGKDVFFKKVNEKGEPLAGAQFKLWADYDQKNPAKPKVDGAEVEYVESTAGDTSTDKKDDFLKAEDGTEYNVTFNVANGIYYMTEDKAPTGYRKNSYVYRIVVGEAGETVTTGEVSVKLPKDKQYLIQRMSDKTDVETIPDIVTSGIMNIPKSGHKIILRKVLKDTYASLEGAKFRIFRADLTELITSDYNEEDHSYTSDESGVYFVDELPEGIYYLVETKEPGEDELSDTPKVFTVKVEGDMAKELETDQSLKKASGSETLEERLQEWLADKDADGSSGA